MWSDLFPTSVTSTFFSFLLCISLLGQANAVDIVVDYSYDTNDWFGAGHPEGAATGERARMLLERAALDLSFDLIGDLAAVETPPNFSSSVLSGEASWFQTISFEHPSTGELLTLENPTIAAGEYRIYAGAGSISGTSIASGEPGHADWGQTTIRDGFTIDEMEQLDQITQEFITTTQLRGKSEGFARWGATVAFDPSADWHYAKGVVDGIDFQSTARHELMHALGFGTSQEWDNLVVDGAFTGPESVRRNYGMNVILDPSNDHWAEGTYGVIGGDASTVALMVPSLPIDDRKHTTNIDTAALADIGWTVNWDSVEPLFAPCNFDSDRDCDLDDLLAAEAFGWDVRDWLASASSVNEVTYYLGDFDLNGEVDSTDLGELLNNFEREGEFGYTQGNVDQHAEVNSTDLALLLNNFGKTGEERIIAVPEPAANPITTLCFTIWFSATIARRRRSTPQLTA